MSSWFSVRFDVMTRILGWLLVGCGVFVAILVLILAVVMFGWDFWRDSDKAAVPGVLLALAAAPQIVCGGLCLRYAALISSYRHGGNGLAPGPHRLTRMAMMVCGMWLTGIIALMGLGLPRSIGTLAIAGVMVAGLGIAGPRRMALWSREAVRAPAS